MPARVAQIEVEVLSAPLPGFARVAQISVEVLHSIAHFVPPPGGSTGAWFKDLEGDMFGDRDTVD